MISLHRLDGRVYIGQSCRQQTELCSITGALDRTALRMAHDLDQLGAGQFGCEFKTAEDILSTTMVTLLPKAKATPKGGP